MQEANFEEAFELIWAKDRRFQREAYLFVREALDHTQKNTARISRGRVRHVTGQELLEGIREYALAQFGPMAMAVFEEWGVRSCGDFGEVVFNMVEAPITATFAEGDFKDPHSFLARLQGDALPLSRFLWNELGGVVVEPAVPEEAAKKLSLLMAGEFNRILPTASFYEPERFAGVRLSEWAKSLTEQPWVGVQRARLNRLLLEEAYPEEILKGPGLLAKTEQDTRTDFRSGYDFWEAFRKPFLPANNQGVRRLEADAARA